jgi:probable HAF family extracellular repeat protein
MKGMRFQGLLGVVITGVLCAAAMGQRFQPLGYLPTGTHESTGFGISYDGAVLIGAGDTAAGYEAFRWQGSMQALGDLPGGGVFSVARGVSGNGLVIVGAGNYDGSAPKEAFRWTASGMVGLGDLPGGTFGSEAWAASADGSVIVGIGHSTIDAEAFRWTQATGMVGLGLLPQTDYSRAFGVSGNGTVIVGDSASFSGSGRSEAFRWTQGSGMVGLGFLVPPGQTRFSTATAVSSLGDVIVGQANTPTSPGVAFRWSSGVMTPLPDLPGGWESSYAYGVSSNGSVIVGWSDGGQGYTQACYWDSSGVHDLRDTLVGLGVDMTGWTLYQAMGVSADGTVIVGYGRNPSGTFEAFRADIRTFVCCTSDYDCDGDVGTDADIQSFFSCLAGQCPPAPCTSTADFNGDGDVGTDADIEAFFRVLAGGVC